ncbi:hypothetical+protein [Methylocapsa aurea]
MTQNDRHISERRACFSLDCGIKCGVNIFTNGPKAMHRAGDVGQARRQALEDRRAQRRRRPQSRAREAARPEVPRQRVLRSARHRAGQIRDAAAGLLRQSVGDPGRRRVWRLAANLLPGEGGLRRRGDCRTGAGEARAARSPQDRRRRSGFPASALTSRRAGTRPGAGEARPSRTGYRPPSQNDRTSAKKPASEDRRPVGGVLHGHGGAGTALRAAGFGGGLPPEARSGLTLFLRRGMWGWVRALTAAPLASQEQTLPSSAALPFTHDGRSSVVRLLAAIAMGSNDDRRLP